MNRNSSSWQLFTNVQIHRGFRRLYNNDGKHKQELRACRLLAVPSYRRVRCRVPSGVEEGKGHVFREISNRERVITKCRKEECKDENERRVLGFFLALFAGDVAEMEWQQVEVRGFFFSSITEAVKITQPKTNRSTDAKTYTHINVHAHTNTNERARRPSHTQPGNTGCIVFSSKM